MNCSPAQQLHLEQYLRPWRLQPTPKTPQCSQRPVVTTSRRSVKRRGHFTFRNPRNGECSESGGTPGTAFTLSGLVVTRSCKPVPNTLVDLWHADANGNYDNRGFTLRGHQFTDPDGRYSFETIIPGVYPGRTRHFHVKYQPRGGRVLTTQLYFPGEPENRRDSLFSPRLLLDVVEQSRSGIFVTVLDIA